MKTEYVFPFGQCVHTVEQVDRTPKKVFVLGVYASAVHAKWISPKGKILVRALAVASEPSIFWRGEDAVDVVRKIEIEDGCGRLEAAGQGFNGPSGRALDDLFLHPLGVDRQASWLCDLVPHSCLNNGQQKAIVKRYKPLIKRFSLPEVTVPIVPTTFTDDARRQQICAELEAAHPQLVVLLGDQPIRWFLSAFDARNRLVQFGTGVGYGKVYSILINRNRYNILPLVHPRQAGGLNSHSSEWKECHHAWLKKRAREVGERYLVS